MHSYDRLRGDNLCGYALRATLVGIHRHISKSKGRRQPRWGCTGRVPLELPARPQAVLRHARPGLIGLSPYISHVAGMPAAASSRAAAKGSGSSLAQLPSEVYVNAKLPSGERVKTNLADYFHLTCRQAACQLGICEQTIKNACRSKGLNRWPFQQVCPHRFCTLLERSCLPVHCIPTQGVVPRINAFMETR